MSNFFSELGQGLTNFGHVRQQRQDQDRENQRRDLIMQNQEAERARSYAWEIASNLSPEQELDETSFAALQKAGPEIAAYVDLDPVTGKRKWRGTQQQQTSAAREKAALDTANRQNKLLETQQAELGRREALTKAVTDFTQTNGRRPTRDELYNMGTSSGALDPKQLIEWDREDARMKVLDAQQERLIAAAGRDNRWTPSAGSGPKAPVQLDVNQLRNEMRRRMAQGLMDPEEYQTTEKELNRIDGLQRNPLQFYMNDVQNDMTGLFNQRETSKNPNYKPQEFQAYRNPERGREYLNYVQSDPDWQMQAQADLQNPEDIQRYQGFVQQLISKWEQEEAQRQQQAGQGGGIRSYLPSFLGGR